MCSASRSRSARGLGALDTCRVNHRKFTSQLGHGARATETDGIRAPSAVTASLRQEPRRTPPQGKDLGPLQEGLALSAEAARLTDRHLDIPSAERRTADLSILAARQFE